MGEFMTRSHGKMGSSIGNEGTSTVASSSDTELANANSRRSVDV